MQVYSITSSNKTPKSQNELSFKGYLGKNVEPLIKRVVQDHADFIVSNANHWKEPLSAANKQSIVDAKNLADRVISKMKSFASGLHKGTCLDFQREVIRDGEIFCTNNRNLVLKNKIYNDFLQVLSHRTSPFCYSPPHIEREFFFVNTPTDSFYSLDTVSDLEKLEGVIDEFTRFTPEAVNKCMFLEKFKKLQHEVRTETTVLGRARNAYNRLKANVLAKDFNVPKENGISWGEKLREYQQKGTIESIVEGILEN